MKTLKLLVVAIVFAYFAGCSDKKIDASSDESMKASVQKVRESLPEPKRKDFDEAMKVLAFSQIEMKDLFAQGSAGAGNLETKMRESLNGKTGEQVIAEADRFQVERKERERKQALEEIRELETKREKSISAREKLKMFQVVRSRFYMKEQRFGRDQPIIEITVKNGTDKAVSRAYFEGTLASPNRSIPWHKDTFNYSISGGLEPGEEASWTLSPNMFSDWGKVDAPADAVFTVTVERLDGADGKSIYSTKEFGEHDSQRLEELMKKFGVK